MSQPDSLEGRAQNNQTIGFTEVMEYLKTIMETLAIHGARSKRKLDFYLT